MLRMIINISLAAAALATLATAASRPARAEEAQPLRRVVALLDYVATDYARAVSPSGELLSAAEHQEQIVFVEDAAKELRADAGDKAEDLAARLDALARAVAAKAPPSFVASEARALRDEIVRRFGVVLLPAKAPDLSRGARVYERACAACHGQDGRPNVALRLQTKPPDFTRREDVGPLSPQRVFNSATYGVPNTQMPAFDTGLTDEERWDVAFYVLVLAHPGASQHGLALARAAPVPTRYTQLAALSDDELRARLAAAGLSDAEQEEALAALRGGPFVESSAQPQALVQAPHDVQRAAQLAREGKRDEARRILVSAYLDHFEPYEAGLRASDAKLVHQVETAFLALRASVESGKDLDASAARLDALLEQADTRGPGGGLLAFVAAPANARH